MEKKELEEKLRGLVIFTERDGQGQATNTTLEEELGEYAMQKVLDLFSQGLDRAREEGIREAVEEAYEYGRDSIRLPMSLTKEQVIDKLLRVSHLN